MLNKMRENNMEEEEITPEWVKENLCMDDGNDITECYSDDTIKHIAWCLRRWKNLDYDTPEKLLKKYHIKYK